MPVAARSGAVPEGECVVKMADAARTLYEKLEGNGLDCIGCGGALDEDLENGGHFRTDCPILALPKIANVLDSVVTLLSRHEPFFTVRGQTSGDGAIFWVCQGRGAPMASAHTPDCLWLAVQAQVGAEPMHTAMREPR